MSRVGMEFGILGPLEVRRAGVTVPVRGPKPRSVLARLLIDANSTVATDRLIDDLWDGEPPVSAVNTLQTYVHQLRAVLDPGILLTRPTGYTIELAPDALDCARFEAAVDEVAGGDLAPDDGAARLRRALSLWRGPMLVDFPGAAWAQADAARFEGLRLWAFEALFDAELARSRHLDVVPELEGLVGEHPLRERLWAQLMLALYRSGRQADALRACSRLRTTLVDELGIQPSREVTRLEQMILDQDPALETGLPGRTVGSAALRAPSGIVSFLLTDVEGSTRAWDRAPGSMSAALGRHDVLMREIVQEHGGVMLKARGEGDSTFSVFERATDAIAAAFTMQQRLASEPWPDETPLKVRIAVHTGEAIERNDDYFGPAVNRAARLRAVAAGGQILVSGSTAELVSDHLASNVVLVELGSRELKDLDRPERVFELCAAEADPTVTIDLTGAQPLTPPLARIADRPFVDREEDLAALLDAWKAARDGTAQTVLVGGEPGVGKTQLSAVIARRLHEEGACVLYGRCDELTLLPYQPFVEAFEGLLVALPGRQREAWTERAGPEVRRLLPSLSVTPGIAPPRPRDPELERFLLFAGVVSLLEQCARERPVLLVVDDLHWADEPTLLLLQHVVTAAPHLRLLIVGSFRESEVFAADHIADFLADMHRVPGVERRALLGLDRDSLLQYLQITVPPVAGPELEPLADVLREETGGNPFFVGEVVRNMAESGTSVLVAEDPLRRGVALDLPESVREVVGRRVRRLGEDARRVLTVAAVIGREFDLGLLAAVADEPEDLVLDVLELAAGASLIAETSGQTGCFGFVHAIIQQTLYEEMSTMRRRRIHQRVAEVMDRLPQLGAGDRSAELAHHWFLADPVAPDRRALVHARAAGEQALARLAPQDARRWFDHGLRLADRVADASERERVELEILLGDAQRQAGDPAYRATLLAAAANARTLDDADLLVRAALANTRGWASAAGTVDHERVAFLEAAIASVGPGDNAARARLLATLAAELSYAPDWQRRLALSDEALAIARRVGDAQTLSYVLTRRPNTIWVPDTLPERLANTVENLGLARRLGDPVPLFWASMYRTVAALAAADLAEADEHLGRLRALAGELGLPVLRWEAAFHSAWRALLAGRLAEADQLASLALEIGTACGQPDALEIYAGQLLLIRYDQGRIADLEDLIGRAATDNPGLPAFTAALALTYVETDRDDDAARLLSHAASDRFAHVPYDQTWLATMSEWSVVCARLRDRDAAALLVERMAPWSDQIVFTGAHVFGAVALYLGLCAATLACYDEAEAQFAKAAALHAQLEAPVWSARTELAWAEMLVDRGADGDLERARDLAVRARQRARGVGSQGIDRRARRLLSGL